MRLRASERTGIIAHREALSHIIALAGAFALFAPARVLAFSDPGTFGKPVTEGGGGGRYFTGSPADGYTCSVCHQGPAGPAVSVLGLPLAGYVPGTSYEVTVDWPDDLENVAVSLEITDRTGMGAGSVRLPPADELFEPERCIPVGAGIPAGLLIDAPGRTIVFAANCGAQRLRFLWTAPTQDVGVLWFAGALVHADGNSDAEGDRVTILSVALPSPSQSADGALAVRGGCSALAPGVRRPRAGATGLWLLSLGFFVRRRRRR